MSLHEKDGERDHLTGFDLASKSVFCFDCNFQLSTAAGVAEPLLAAKEHQHTHRTTNPDPREVNRP